MESWPRGAFLAAGRVLAASQWPRLGRVLAASWSLLGRFLAASWSRGASWPRGRFLARGAAKFGQEAGKMVLIII